MIMEYRFIRFLYLSLIWICIRAEVQDQWVTGCILSNVTTPSMTTLIGQPQYETSQPIYQNNNMPSKPTAAKILGKVGESLSWICCVHPPVERFSFVDDNANLGMVMRYKEIGSWEYKVNSSPEEMCKMSKSKAIILKEFKQKSMLVSIFSDNLSILKTH
ncbi:TPA: nicotinamide mononucleotide adenylyltransferase 2-like [Bos taurus]|nr:TPA: nicotinamide mononucleotide adenylyltransferase 2-like [Bos taurus]